MPGSSFKSLSTPLMRRTFPGVSALAFAAALGLGSSAALAQATAPLPAPAPSVQAVDYAPIPAGSVFEVQSNDDSENSQEAIDRVHAELANHGYAAQDGAPLVMVIETDLIRGDKQDDPLGQVHADNDEAAVQARLFSTSQNSLLNPQRPIGSADRTYRINVSVYDRASGLYVWRGSAVRNDPNLDVSQASNEMIAALMGAVGKSVAIQKISN
jgi:hypothetical protein